MLGEGQVFEPLRVQLAIVVQDGKVGAACAKQQAMSSGERSVWLCLREMAVARFPMGASRKASADLGQRPSWGDLQGGPKDSPGPYMAAS